MRIVGMLTMTALILTGLPPAPIGPAPAEAQSRRMGYAQPRGDDPDARCAPFLQAGGEYDDNAGYGRGRMGNAVNRPSTRYGYNAPPAPPPPSPPIQYAPPSPADQSIAVTGSRVQSEAQRGNARQPVAGGNDALAGTIDQRGLRYGPAPRYVPSPENRERYAGREVSSVLSVADQPVSTFSVDVDTGAYSNVRRMLNQGQMPPEGAVRTEELINYFRYDYPLPQDRSRPFSVNTDMTTTPWNPETRLLRVGLRGYDLPRSQRPAANLVFLVDVSGSMSSPDKLPLVQCSLALLADRLSPRDRVSIVVYAGAAGVVLQPTSSRNAVVESLKNLHAGGSTAGAQGIQLAYDIARRNMIDDGINRVILATDGDFNVGTTNNDALVNLVERQRRDGITLTTLGFGTGNYNEAMMEQIADHGNGNYAYIDSPREAQKVLEDELSSTLFTIAHDVKIQIEFNPTYVSEYRLIGYENRALREEDFDNDAVDAGDIGAGHQVTAIYEIVPVGGRGWLPQRRYEGNQRRAMGDDNGEFAFLRLRYKLPGQDESRLIEQPVRANLLWNARQPTGDTAFAIAVAAYGQLLRGDTNLGDFSFADARALAERGAGGNDLRREFLGLTRLAERQLLAANGGRR
ncbi:von Willebrand factor type A domain-containing protein [Allosphingosinicella sp.]|uniref:vWA domain-containing protein n=1 Tax=Allosphingosinicella sp. TaxID=2823234 RepID=UPI0037836708